MKLRHCLLYAIVSFLSFNITLILSMLFYNQSSRTHVGHMRRRPDPVLPVPADDIDDVEETHNENWDEVKKRAEAAAAVG